MIYSVFNRPPRKPIFLNYMYTYNYLDEDTRKIVSVTVDQAEQMFSNDVVSVAEQVESGTLSYGGFENGENYIDCTTVPADLSSLLGRADSLSKAISAYLSEQGKKADEASIEAGKDNGENTSGTVENKKVTEVKKDV